MSYRFLSSESALAFSRVVEERYPNIEVVFAGQECVVRWHTIPDAKAIAELDRSLQDISLELCGRSEPCISITSVISKPEREDDV